MSKIEERRGFLLLNPTMTVEVCRYEDFIDDISEKFYGQCPKSLSRMYSEVLLSKFDC